MGAAVTAEPKSKKSKSDLSPEAAPAAESSFQLEAMYGATAGMPLFLDVGLQRKLAVGAVDDPLEREADQVAEAVMSSGDFASASHGRSVAPGEYLDAELGFGRAGIQRKCACGGSSSGECAECQEKREEEPSGTTTIHRRVSGNGNGSGASEAPPIVHQALSSPGQPLDASARPLMESRFGRDFGDVRVHTDSLAAQSAHAVNALAYTVGRDIVFGEGQHDSTIERGHFLLAHELTHVIQQGGDQRTRPSELVHGVGIQSRSLPSVQRFGSTEHERLGETTGVTTIDLGGGVVLSWGQIVALAGDYYGTLEDLEADTRTPEGQKRIRAAMEAGGLPTVASTSLPVPDPKAREELRTQYLQLVVHNIPHFLAGGTSRETWLQHHWRAIDTAVREGLAGTPLNRAYFIEAFGEHFYTDSFSGGHIRTPRKEISDWYSTVFGPRVVDHFINTLRSRVEREIYDQVAGLALTILSPAIAAGVHLFIHNKVGEKLDAAIAAIGGRAVMVEWFGLIVGGMVSGSIHDLEGDRGVVVNSKAHPTPWTAYGDGLLDDPRNAASEAEAVAGIAEAKADIDQAYLIGVGERIAKASVPIPAPSALPATIYFGFDSSAVNPTARADLTGALAYMTYNPDVEVSIVGHTDPIGYPGYNMGLGSRRADAVASVLTGGGVAARRVPTSSAGESSLVTTRPSEYWRDRRVTLVWTWPSSGSAAASHDVAYERSMAAVNSRIGPPYWAEKRFPEPVAGANPAIPEWHWGRLDPTFQGQIASWVGRQVTPYVGTVTSSPALAPISIPVAGTTVTVDPRPIVRGIVDDLLANPIAFLNAGFGEVAGP